MKFINLLPNESTAFIERDRALTLGTFYEIQGTFEEAENTKNRLETRIKEILDANPWLCGRLIRRVEDGMERLSVAYEETVKQPDVYIDVITNDYMFMEKHWEIIGEAIGPFTVKVAGDCIDKDEPICKFLIIQNRSRTELAVVLSLNHTIADGTTFYLIWKMMDQNEKVTKLKAERDQLYGETVARYTNFYVQQNMSFCEYFTEWFGTYFRGLIRALSFKSKPQVFYVKFKKEAIDQRKEMYASKNIKVSTNDILISWFFGTERCPGNNVYIPLDMRGKLPGCSNDMAGSYHCFANLRTQDLQNPVALRKRVELLSKKQAEIEDPTFASKITDNAFNLGTNITSLYHKVELNAYKHSFHTVMIHPPYFDWITGVPMTMERAIYIFKTNNEEFAALIQLYNDLPKEYFTKNELVTGEFF